MGKLPQLRLIYENLPSDYYSCVPVMMPSVVMVSRGGLKTGGCQRQRQHEHKKDCFRFRNELHLTGSPHFTD
jgi:hypothetical protein